MPNTDFTSSNYSPTPVAHPHSREARPVFFSLLTTHKPPDKRVVLVAEGSGAKATKLEFNPLVTWKDSRCVFGQVEFLNNLAIEQGWSADVWRGRKGNKPPEQICILTHCPKEMPAWPKPQYNGFVKAVTRAFTSLEPSDLELEPRAWVAIEFALKGMARRGISIPVGTAGLVLDFAVENCVVPTESYLVWNEHISRCLDQLNARLSHPKKSNPLLSQLDLRQVWDWLPIRHRDIATLVLETFAKDNGLPLEHSPEPHVVLAGCDFPEREPTDDDNEVVAKVLAKFVDGEGATREALGKLFPAKQHVISWLFDAHVLQMSPEGFVFTRDELTLYANGLEHVFSQPAPSVRDIKDKLELPRKKAEQLRDFFVALEGDKSPKRKGGSS